MARNKKYETVEQLQELIDKYFDDCDNRKKQVATKAGIKTMKSPKPYSIEGLAAALNMSRQSLNNYEKNKGYELFFDTILIAKQKVLADIAERALEGTNNGTFSQFLMKNNFGYKDKQEIEQTNIDKYSIIEEDEDSTSED